MLNIPFKLGEFFVFEVKTRETTFTNELTWWLHSMRHLKFNQEMT